MATIKRVTFSKVGKKEGCLCERCGQYIINIWSVEYNDGLNIRLGVDCFENIWKSSGLSEYGKKLFKKTLKRIEDHKKGFEAEKKLTPETDKCWQFLQQSIDESDRSYWYGREWEEYHKWMLEEWWTERFNDDQKEIDRFKKVKFNI